MLMLTEAAIPAPLQQISHPPKQLFHRGASLEDLLSRPRVSIIGSRSVSAYGRQVTQKLAMELSKQGIVIISGLALGVDAIAHKAALDAGGLTIAVLPSPVNRIYPSTNVALANRILEQGGALLSEYESENFEQAYKSYFIARNRLVAGLSQAVLITEAAVKSGSLHTARFALEQGKDVLAVPGDITRIGSVGTNNLIRAGAIPVTSYLDVLHSLGLEEHHSAPADIKGRNQHEQIVLDLLLRGTNEGDSLLKASRLTASEFNQVLTMLEIGGKIRSLGSNRWSLY